MKKHLLIIGKVQGVGFRNWLYTKAVEKNINGWVKNTKEGNVETLLIGEEKDVNEIIRLCKMGPSASKVVKIRIKDYQQDYPDKSFNILLSR